MTPEPINHLDEVGRLLGLLLAGELVPEDCRRLEQMLLSDAAALEYYQDYVEVHSLLHWQHGLADEADGPNAECGMMNDELPCKAGIVLDLHAAAPIHHSPFIIHHLPSVPSYVGGVLFSYLIAAVILSTALAVAWAWKLPSYTEIARESVPLHSPSATTHYPLSTIHSSVGRITGMVDCKWEGRRKDEGGRMKDELPTAGNGIHPSSFIPHPSSPVSLGERYALTSGLLEITYNSGAKVILQGPCTYEVESAAGGYLSVGKLTAKVENKEERRTKTEEPSASRSSFLIPHSYFTVRTPIATVTDLGTEFGVEVGEEGQTTSRVFRGSVEMRAMAVDEEAASARVLRENESAVVGRVGGSGQRERATAFLAAAKSVEFVRTLPKTTLKILDLVDVVAGGDGFSGGRNKGIDPTTGRLSDAEPRAPRLVDDGKYHRAVDLPLVDGVFVPDGRTGSIQVDSAGHRFDGFPATAYEACGSVWAGGTLPIDDPERPELRAIPTRLDGIDRASAGHGLIFLHANKGVTFDLEAIRRANPECKLARFRAVAGNMAEATVTGKSVYADLWVIVDGQTRWQRRQINGTHGAFSIVISLHEQDRFLTLVATDGGDGIEADWTMFGDPRLELTPRVGSARSTVAQ